MKSAFERLVLSRDLVVTGGLAWGAVTTGPIFIGAQMQPIPAALAGIALITGLRYAAEWLELSAYLAERIHAHRPTGKEGTARWASAKTLRRELARRSRGPFWGRMGNGVKKPIFAEFASNAVTVAPAGSGKGICSVVPCAFSVRQSKLIADFKGELSCIMKVALEKRGEKVCILNPGGLWADRLGESDSYNPLDIIADDLHRPGGLRDVPDDLREQCAQILPEPGEDGGESKYWREGSRRCQSIAMLVEVMVEGYSATLSSVAMLIEDRQALEFNLRWIVGVDVEGNPHPDGPMPIEQADWAKVHDPDDLDEFVRWVRAQASGLLKLMSGSETRTFDSFISGAQQALAPFAFGRLAPAMRRSTFSMDDLKSAKRPMSLFIVADASRMEAYKAYIGLMQWCAMTAIKRHANKDVPVYFLMDEATNYKIHGLESLLTWGRSYGLRLHLIFQDFSAFERTYGRTALETLLSETEIKQFLPGQRSPKTLALISKMLGEQSVMNASLSAQQVGYQEQVSESARPLMTPDEIRRTEFGLLLIRKALPALIEPVSYAEVQPWRKLAGINPFHGKRFLRRVKIRLWFQGGGW